MPFRVGEKYGLPTRATITIQTSVLMRRAIRKAAEKRGIPSNNAYINTVLVEAIERDLGYHQAELRSQLPKPSAPRWEPGESGRTR